LLRIYLTTVGRGMFTENAILVFALISGAG
jgi:hypothetical protein